MATPNALIDHYVVVDGIRTRYLETGNGSAVVLIHGRDFGGGTGAQVFPPNFYRAIAESGHRVVGFDRLGQAQTDNPSVPERYRISAVVEHGIAVLEVLGLSGATLVGQSRGAYVAARIAVERPDLVRRLVLFNTGTLAPGVGVEPKPGDATYRVYNELMTGDARNDAIVLSYSTEHISDEWLAENQRYRDSAKSKEARRILADVARDFYDEFAAQKKDTLAQIAGGGFTGPTQIIWGVGDPTLNLAASVPLFEVFRGAVKHLRLHVINGAGHLLFREHPEETARVITDFIESTS